MTFITQQTFSVRCSELTAAATEEDGANEFGNNSDFSALNIFDTDLASLLQLGNKDISSLTIQFLQIRERCSEDMLSTVMSSLPNKLPSLTRKLDHLACVAWIKYSLENNEKNPLHIINQHITPISWEGNSEGDLRDAIREAVAFNKTSLLVPFQNSITADNIELKDMIDAAIMNSFSTFAWLNKYFTFNTTQLVELFSEFSDATLAMKEILSILKLSPAKIEDLTQYFEGCTNKEFAPILALLNQGSR